MQMQKSFDRVDGRGNGWLNFCMFVVLKYNLAGMEEAGPGLKDQWSLRSTDGNIKRMHASSSHYFSHSTLHYILISVRTCINNHA